MRTISDGRVGFSELILSVVFPRLPPIISSYSRPSWPRTFSMAARILRAFSSRVKSKNVSFTNRPSRGIVRGREASRVAMLYLVQEISQIFDGRRNSYFSTGGRTLAAEGALSFFLVDRAQPSE